MAIFVSSSTSSVTSKHSRFSTVPDDPTGIAGSDGNRVGSSGQPKADSFDSKSPRPVNTGAQITVPIVNQFLIDWLAFTLKHPDSNKLIEILNLDSDLFTELDRGGSGYLKSMRSGGIAIYYNGRKDMGCHCVMSGQGCRQYEAHFSESPWPDLLKRAFANKITFTRLDLAHDNVDSTLDLVKLEQAVLDSTIRTRFRSVSNLKCYDLQGTSQTGGNTIYFGKRNSRVYLRFYDKAAQMGVPFVWNRAEFELKEKRAHQAAKLLASGIPAGRLFVGIINNYLTVVDKSNVNISRCPSQGWWTDWLSSTEKIKLTTAPHLKTISEVMEFLKRQYGPTLATIKTHLGPFIFNEFIRSVIKDGEARMNMRHEMMLYVSALGVSGGLNDGLVMQDERAAIMEYDGGLPKQAAELAAQDIEKEKVGLS